MTEILGIAGAALILVAFSLNQIGTWKTIDKKYDAINILGSGMLLMYAYLLGSVPFMILNIVWLLVSVRQIMK